MKDQYRGSVVYDENEEYDSEEDDEPGKPKRKSFKKARPSLAMTG